jgi:hypothetical protein
MPAKKEVTHDCKAECAELHKQLVALKKEISALKKELKAKPSGGADPRLELLVKHHNTSYDKNLNMTEKRKIFSDIADKLRKM